MLGALQKLGKLLGRSAEVARPSHNVRLSLEPLEDRRVLSVNAAITGGVLEVTGTMGSSDVVSIGLDAGGQIAVTHAGGTQTFNPADITNHQIDVDLGGGADTLTLALIQNGGQGFDISVDMGNGADVVHVQENVGSGALLPSLNVTSETIHFGGALGDSYETDGLTLNGNVFLDGSVTVSTHGGDFIATDATLSARDANTNDELVPDFDLTVNTDAGDVHIGVMNAAGGAHINSFIVNSGGNVTFESVAGASVTVGSLDVHGATITVEDSISVTEGDATFESDGAMTFDPGGAADIVIDTHGHNLTFVSDVTEDPAFVIDSSDVAFQSTGVDGAAGGIVTFRPADAATPVEIGTPAVPDPDALQIDPALFAEFSGFDGFQIGGLGQTGTISVLNAVVIDSGLDLHLHAGAGDIFIGAPITAVGDVTVTGDGSTTTINANMTAGSLTFNDDVIIAAPNVTLRANGAIGEITFDSTIDSEAGEENNLTLDANGDISVAGAIGATDRLNDLQIDDADDVTLSGTVRLAGDLTQVDGDGTTTVNGTGGTGIAGVLDVTTNAVVFNTADMVTVGNVTIDAQNAITLNGAAGINAGASTISLAANQDGVGTAAFTQNGTGIIQTTNNVGMAVSIAVGGSGSALLGDIRAASGTVLVNAGGAIQDNLAAETPNVTANTLALVAVTGIGTDLIDLDISADVLAARTNSGDINVVDAAGGLTIGTVPGVVTGVQIAAGAAGDDIRVVTSGLLTISNAVINTNNVGGNITLIAGGATAADDLLVNANVTTVGGSGSISLFAGDSIQVAAIADVEASGSGNVLLSAGTDASGLAPANGTSTGEISVADGAEITSDDGNITLRAPGDVRISLIDANDDVDAARGDVLVQADFAGVAGGLSDGAGAIFDNLIAETANVVADQVELRAAAGIGSADDIDTDVVSLVAVNTTAGDIVLTEVAAGTAVNVVELSQAGAANIQLTATAGSITVVAGGSGVTAGTGIVTLTAQGAASDIILQQDITTAAGGSVSLVAGDDIADDGIATTLITTGNLSLSAVDNIGDLTNFATGAGTPIDVAVPGLLQQAAIATVGSGIFIRAQGNLTAAAGAINPAAGGVASALVTATGNLDVGTFGGFTVTPGDNLGLLAGGTLTVPAVGINVGASGALRLAGNVDVQDGDHILGPFVANSLEFLSGSLTATQLTTIVASLTADMTALGTSLIVVEQDAILLQSVTTNDGDLVVVLATPGDMTVRQVDAGTALAALIAAPFAFLGGSGSILDGDGPVLDTVDVTGGQVVLVASQGIGTDASALEIDGGILAATTVTGDINVSDVAGGVTVGSISVLGIATFNGVTLTGGVLGNDVRLATQGAGADLAIDNVVSTVGSGTVVLSASDDVSFTAIGSITSVIGNVTVDAGGGIAMVDGSQIVTTGGGIVDLQAQNDIALSRVVATLSEVTVTSTSGAITDAGDLLGANISANQAALRAADGIGIVAPLNPPNPLETDVTVLSARNTASGNIEVANVRDPAFGALFTIGTVDGLAGIVNTAPGGAVVISNFGPINVTATVASAGGINITAQTPTLLPVNPGNLTVNGRVAATGAIVLAAGNDLTVNSQVAALAAVALNAANNLSLNDSGQPNDVVGDTVTGSAGNTVTFGPNVIVRSTNPAIGGAVADKLPDFTPVLPDTDNDPDLIAQLPFLEVLFNIGRAGEENLSVEVLFGTEDTDNGTFDGVNLNAPLNGTILDSGAGFTITFNVADPDGITFSEGGVVVELPPIEFDFLPIFVPINIQLPQATPFESALPNQTAPTTFVALLVPVQQQTTFDDLPVAPDVAPSTDVRIIIVEKIGPDDQVEQDRTDRPIVREFVDAEAEAILENPSKLFEQLKSGRFRIWLKDGLDAPRNLIWDVILQDGRPQAGGEGTERPPTEIPGDTPEGATPQGELAPPAKTSDTAVPGAAAPEAHSVRSVDGAPPVFVTPETTSVDFGEQQDASEQSGQRSEAIELPPQPSQPPLPENGWRITRRLSDSTSTLRSTSP
jgi:hypothetical protein